MKGQRYNSVVRSLVILVCVVLMQCLTIIQVDNCFCSPVAAEMYAVGFFSGVDPLSAQPGDRVDSVRGVSFRHGMEKIPGGGGDAGPDGTMILSVDDPVTVPFSLCVMNKWRMENISRIRQKMVCAYEVAAPPVSCVQQKNTASRIE